MTVKGKQNHYNIKILKGYGFSINVKNSKIVLKNTADPFKEPEVEEWFVNNMPYEKIVMSGKGYVSTEALSLLSEHNRNLILVDTYGRATTYLNPVTESLTNTRYRIGQYDTFRDKAKCDYLSRQIVKAKLDSQINFLRSTNKPELQEGISLLENFRNQIENSVPISFTSGGQGPTWANFWAHLFVKIELKKEKEFLSKLLGSSCWRSSGCR